MAALIPAEFGEAEVASTPALEPLPPSSPFVRAPSADVSETAASAAQAEFGRGPETSKWPPDGSRVCSASALWPPSGRLIVAARIYRYNFKRLPSFAFSGLELSWQRTGFLYLFLVSLSLPVQ